MATCSPNRSPEHLHTEGDGICSDCGRNVVGVRNNPNLRCNHCGGSILFREVITDTGTGVGTVNQKVVPAASERYPQDLPALK